MFFPNVKGSKYRYLGTNVGSKNTTSPLLGSRKLLYNLYENLTESELDEVKFLLNRDLPRRKLDKSAVSVAEVDKV